MPNFELTVTAREGGIQRTAIVRNAEGSESAAQHAMLRGWNIDAIRMVGDGYKPPPGSIEMNADAPPTAPGPLGVSAPLPRPSDAEMDEARNWTPLAGCGLLLSCCGVLVGPLAPVGMLTGAYVMARTKLRVGRQAMMLGAWVTIIWCVIIFFGAIMTYDRMERADRHLQRSLQELERSFNFSP